MTTFVPWLLPLNCSFVQFQAIEIKKINFVQQIKIAKSQKCEWNTKEI